MQTKEKKINNRIIFFCFVALLCAIVFSKNIFDANPYYISFFGILFVVLLVLTIKSKMLKTFFAIFFCFLFGLGASWLDLHYFLKDEVFSNCVVTGIVDTKTDSYVVLTNTTFDGVYYKNIIVKTYGKNLDYGYEISFTGYVSTIDGFTLGEFNSTAYKFYAPYTSTVDIDDIQILSTDKQSLSQKIKIKVRNVFRSSLPEGDAALFYGILFGDKSEIDFELRQSYSTSGIAHILAVSGLHVGFFVSMINFVLKKTKLKNRTKLIITSIFLLIYCSLCSFAPSVCRASIMAIILMLSTSFGRQYDFVNSISLSGIIVLLFRPLSAFDVGLQLSYLCVFSIAFIHPLLLRLFTKIHIPNFLANSLALTICVQIGLFPLTASYFGQVSLLTFVTNIICVPLFQVAYIGIFLSTIISCIFPFMSFVLVPFKYLMDFIALVANAISSVAILIVKLPRLNFAIILCYFLLVVIFSRFVNIKILSKIIICLSITLAVLGYCIAMRNYQYNDNFIVFQYQNYCRILKSQSGQTLMITDSDEVYYTFTNYINIYKVDYVLEYNSVTCEEVAKYYNSITINADCKIGDFEIKYINLVAFQLAVQIKVDDYVIYFLPETLSQPSIELLRYYPDADIIINGQDGIVAKYLLYEDYVYHETEYYYTNFELEIKNLQLQNIRSLN